MAHKRHRITDLPVIPRDTEPHERAAIESTLAASESVRAAGGTLIARIVNKLVRERRSVQWTFHSTIATDASVLEHTIVSTWDSRERVLTAIGEPMVYCRGPLEALAAGLASLKKFEESGRKIHESREVIHRPRPKRPSNRYGASVSGRSHLVNRKPTPDDGNR